MHEEFIGVQEVKALSFWMKSNGLDINPMEDPLMTCL